MTRKVGESDLGQDIIAQITADDEPDELIEEDDSDDGLEGDKIIDVELDDDDTDVQLSDEGDELPEESLDHVPEEEDDTTPVEKAADGEDVDEFDPYVRLQEDAKGNLLTPSGRIIARSGRERSLFESWRKRYGKVYAQAEKMGRSLTQITDAAKTLKTNYDLLDANKNMFEQSGLTSEDQRQMLDIGIAFKADPIVGIKKMLTMAHLAGIDITELGVAGGLDGKAISDQIKEHITEQLKPFTTRETTERERADKETEAQNEATQFFRNNPDAKDTATKIGHENFVTMMQKGADAYPEMSFTEIWLRIKEANRNHVASNKTTKKKRATRPVSRRGKRKSPRSTSNESYSDIGRDVLKELNALNQR